MKTKRILSVLLAACLLFGLIPGAALPARAANPDPTYNRDAAPEVAIFNAINGKSSDFFTQEMKKDTFNAVEAGKFGSLR